MGPGVLEQLQPDLPLSLPGRAARFRDEELAAALEGLRNHEVSIVFAPERPISRLQFADDVAASLALGKHDPARLKEQFEIARVGAVGFVNFATRLWQQYMRVRDLDVEVFEATHRQGARRLGAARPRSVDPFRSAPRPSPGRAVRAPLGAHQPGRQHGGCGVAVVADRAAAGAAEVRQEHARCSFPAAARNGLSAPARVRDEVFSAPAWWVALGDRDGPTTFRRSHGQPRTSESTSLPAPLLRDWARYSPRKPSGSRCSSRVRKASPQPLMLLRGKKGRSTQTGWHQEWEWLWEEYKAGRVHKSGCKDLNTRRLLQASTAALERRRYASKSPEVQPSPFVLEAGRSSCDEPTAATVAVQSCELSFDRLGFRGGQVGLLPLGDRARSAFPSAGSFSFGSS